MMPHSVDSEEKPFLDHEQDDEDQIPTTSRRGASRSSERRLLILSTILNAALLVISILLGILLSSSKTATDSPLASDQRLPETYCMNWLENHERGLVLISL